MTDKLTSLRQLTTVVADTGDIAAMKLYQPQDANQPFADPQCSPNS